jgi:hypothetical protein
MKTRTCNCCNKNKKEGEYSPSFWSKPQKYEVTCRTCIRKRNGSLCTPKKGYIYIITNQAWEDWCKIGLTVTTVESRLSTYQTGSPFRDYKIYATKQVSDVGKAEKVIHSKLEADGYSRNSEWFNISPETAFTYLEDL